MVNLILVRHGNTPDPDYSKWPDDHARPLTEKGVRRFKKAASGLKKLARPTRVVTSPAARAMQTAQLLEWDADWPSAVADERLDETHSIADVLAMIKALPEWPCDVAIVGHGPNLDDLIYYLISEDNIADRFESFDKGSSASIRVSSKLKKNTGTLNWYHDQKELKSLR